MGSWHIIIFLFIFPLDELDIYVVDGGIEVNLVLSFVKAKQSWFNWNWFREVQTKNTKFTKYQIH